MFLIIIVILVLVSVKINAQELAINGSFGVSADAYLSNSNSRYPTQTYRTYLKVNIGILEQIYLPFEIFLHNNKVGYQQPFNQFGITPRIGNWLDLYGGWYSTRISDFTFGDLRVLGGGFELKPKSFRLAFHYGFTRLARDPDSNFAFHGEYKQQVIIGKIGLESTSGNYLSFQIMTIRDIENSIRRDSLTPFPRGNSVLSISGGINSFNGQLKARFEIASSIFTNNVLNKNDSALSLPRVFAKLTPVNNTSNIDGAARLNLTVLPNTNLGVSLDAQWIGPGFVSLGFAQMLNDELNLSISPFVRFLDGKISFRTLLSRRSNNLRNNRLATIDRLMSNTSLNIQATKEFIVDINFGYFSMTSNHTNDTLKTDTRTFNFIITPSFKFTSGKVEHLLSSTFNYQKTINNNIISKPYGGNTLLGGAVNYSTNFPSKLILNTSFNYNLSEIFNQKINYFTFNESVSYQFLEKFTVRGTLGANATYFNQTNLNLLLRFSLSYSLRKWGTLTFYVMTNHQNLISSNNVRYSELFGGLQYLISF